jgi:hypothetical protein
MSKLQGRQGRLYQLQAIGDLRDASDPAAWENVEPPLNGQDAPMELRVQPPAGEGAGQRFYRLLVLPR